MKTVTDAVRELGGVWPFYVGGEYLVYSHSYGYIDFTIPSVFDELQNICTRAEFDAEARRQGFIEISKERAERIMKAINDMDQWDLEAEWGGVWLPAMFVCEHLGNKLYAIDTGCDTPLYWPLHESQARPLQSDRDRWVEAASKEFVVQDWPALGRIYDAMQYGTLPVPEVRNGE